MLFPALADLAAALADAGDWAPPARPTPPAAAAPVEPIRPVVPPRPKAPVPPPPAASVLPGRIPQAPPPPPPPPLYQLRGGSGTTWTHPDPRWLAAWVRQSDPPRPVQLVPRYTYTYGAPCVGGVCRVRGR